MLKFEKTIQNLINAITIGVALNEEPLAREVLKEGDTLVFKQPEDSFKLLAAYMEHGAPRSLVHCSLFVHSSPMGRDYGTTMDYAAMLGWPDQLWDQMTTQLPEPSITDGQEYEIVKLLDELVDEFKPYFDKDGLLNVDNPNIPEDLISRDNRLLVLRNKSTGHEFSTLIGIALADYAHIRANGVDQSVTCLIAELQNRNASGAMLA